MKIAENPELRKLSKNLKTLKKTRLKNFSALKRESYALLVLSSPVTPSTTSTSYLGRITFCGQNVYRARFTLSWVELKLLFCRELLFALKYCLNPNYFLNANYFLNTNYFLNVNYFLDANYFSNANYFLNTNYFLDANYFLDVNYFLNTNYFLNVNYFFNAN